MSSVVYVVFGYVWDYIDLFFFFFFNDTATTEIYTLFLHDALPICPDPLSVGTCRALSAKLASVLVPLLVVVVVLLVLIGRAHV